MVTSFSSIIIGLLWGSLAIFLIHLLFNYKYVSFSIYDAKLLLFVSMLIVIRLFCPVELPITYTIKSTSILPQLNEIMNMQILSHMEIWKIMCCVFLLGSFTSVFIKVIRYKRMMRVVKRCSLAQDKLIAEIMYDLERVYHKKLNDISVVKAKYVREPFITGLVHSYIVLPNYTFSDKNLYFLLRHEVEHYIHKDLWIKVIYELLTILYWWNPFIYILRNHITNILEVHNDLNILKNASEYERLEYLKCITQVVKEKKYTNSTIALGFNSGYLLKRYRSVLDNTQKVTKRYLVGYIISLGIFIVSLLMVVEPYYMSSDKVDGSFVMNSSDSYIIQNNNYFELYANGIYVGKIQKLTKELEELPIKKLEEKNE